MRADLLREISEKNNITNAIVLTHNIDFVFLQTVVLAKLRPCGHPTLTVFADAGCAAASYANQAPVLEGLGVRFRVVPIEMEPGFRFHPKAVLLSGPTEAILYVGSGNLTFGGWRENAECWVRFQVSENGTAPFAAFLKYLTLILGRVALAEQVKGEVDEAFDPATRGWAANLGPAGQLFGRPSSGSSLLDQMQEHLGTKSVDKLSICAPYFDDQGDALAAIIRDFAGSEVSLLVQPGRTGLKQTAWNNNSGSAQLRPVSYLQENDKDGPEAFIHAKYYAFEHGDRTTVFLGSANCSRAGLLIPGEQGNAELLAVQEMATDEFRNRFEAELKPVNVALVLPTHVPETDLPSTPQLRLLAASYDNGYLLIAYAPTVWKITKCDIDGSSIAFETLGPGSIRAPFGIAPREVTLEGTDGSTCARTAPRWVDHEWQLRSTAKSRGLGDSIRKNVRIESWGFGAWAEVLEVFCSHLAYLPSQTAGRPHSGHGKNHPAHSAEKYTAEDVFAPNFSIPSVSAIAQRLSDTSHDGVYSLQQLLLRWFAVAPEEPEKSEQTDDTEGTDEEPVDRPEKLPVPKQQLIVLKAATKQEAQRAARVLEKLCKAMTAEAFLANRPPETLCADLKLTSILFRVALRAGWIDGDSFFASSNRIWSSLFYDEQEGTGWIQRRYQNAQSPADFAAVFRSPELVAALASWAMAVSPRGQSSEHSRFFLGSALVIARLPWLWDGHDQDQLGRAFAEILAHAGMSGKGELETFTERWVHNLRRGHALRRLEEALRGQNLSEIARRVQQPNLKGGDLLWQGKLGFCVVIAPAERILDVRVPVLRVFGAKDKATLKGHLTLPIFALLDPRVLPLTSGFGALPRSTLADFLNELSNGLASKLK
jgi:hypothetical protein